MVDPDVVRKLEELFPRLRAHGVTTVRLFGSAARGELGLSSDVDVLVEFKDGDAARYFEVLFELEDALGRQVDLVLPETLHRRIRSRVLDEALKVA